jgi:hypothetical protein
MSTLQRSIAALVGALLFVTVWLVPGVAQQKPAAAAAVPALLRNYSNVTAARLMNPEPDNWLAIRRTYDGWGYSPLTQITTANVGQLRRVWNIPTGEGRVHEAAPIVNNGVMFITTPNNQVIAVNAKPVTSCGDINGRGRLARSSCTTRTAASPSTVTRCITPPARRSSWRSTPAPAARSGPQSWRITSRRTTLRWLL